MARFSLSWLRSPRQVAGELLSMTERIQRANTEAVGRIKDLAEKTAQSREWSRQTINRQDSPSRAKSRASNSRPKVNLTASGPTVEIEIRVGPYWTTARKRDQSLSPSMLSALNSVGLSELLVRKGLVLKQDRTRTVRKKGFSYSVSDRYVPFSGNHWLEAWARRVDRGQQYYRHKIRLTDGQILEKLVLDPTINVIKQRGIPVWAATIEEAIGRG